jgi:acyl dehydratase
MKGLFFEDVEVGTHIPNVVKKVNLLQLIRYSAATWNFYLLHLEREFAYKKGFRDTNIHAPLYGAFLATMMTRWAGDPGRLKRLNYAVKVMGFPGDTLNGKGMVVKKFRDGGENLVDCDIWVENQDGVKVGPGSATISLPSKEG